MTLHELFLEYDLKRNRSAVLAEARRAALYREFPALEELLGRREEVCLAQLRDTIAAPKNREAIAAAARAELAQIDEQLQRLVPAERLAELEPAHECEICADTGYDDRGSRRTLCRCMLARVYRELYGAIPEELREGSFEAYSEEIFRSPEQQKQAKLVKIYAERYAEHPEKPVLIFMGNSGLGKSYAMSCIARRMSEQGRSVLYISSFALFRVFHQARLGEDLPLEPIYDAEALFIDDLGTEPMTVNVTQESIFRLLEHRIRRNLPTVISTNMNNLQLKERYTEKVTSRIFAAAYADVIRMAGEDIRLK